MRTRGSGIQFYINARSDDIMHTNYVPALILTTDSYSYSCDPYADLVASHSCALQVLLQVVRTPAANELNNNSQLKFSAAHRAEHAFSPIPPPPPKKEKKKKRRSMGRIF